MADLSSFADMPVDVEIELDRRNTAIDELLALDGGSIVLLTKAAGENVDVLIGGMRIGSGEIVVLEDKMAIRITGLSERE